MGSIEHCQEIDSHLVTIETSSEFEFITDGIRDALGGWLDSVIWWTGGRRDAVNSTDWSKEDFYWDAGPSKGEKVLHSGSAAMKAKRACFSPPHNTVIAPQ